jgi:RNA polymerase sigma-70 factor (ECF subfamily)
MMGKSVSKATEKKRNGFLDPSEYDTLSDQEIIDLVLKEDVNFFELLLRRYNQQLYRIVRSYLSEEEEIKEVMQKAYVNAFEHLRQFRGDSKFSTWLIRIGINEALKHIQQDQKVSDAEIENPDKNSPVPSLVDTDTPEKNAMRSDFKKLLEDSIDTLPRKYRSVYIMREIEQMDTQETAECLSISESNVKVRLHRARKQLREELEKRVHSTEIFDFKGERCDQIVLVVMYRIYQLETNWNDYSA